MSLSTAWGFAWKKGAAGKKVSGTNPNLSFSCVFWAGKRGQNHLVLDEFRTQINPRLAPERGCRRKSLIYIGILGWLMGLEPTTTGITITKQMYFPLLMPVEKLN